MRLPRFLLLPSASLVLFLAACAGGGSGIPQCDDEIDNDSDGLVDNADPACQAGGTREDDDPPAQCGDGIDNDADGLTDGADPGCENDDDPDEYDGSGAACMDGLDNDGDGKTDYPNDPGCLAPNQGSGEADDCPSGPNCPQCGNGVDDDFDGKVDYQGGDTGCMSASDRDEFSLDANACGAGTSVSPLPMSGTVSGSLSAGTSNVNTTCGGSVAIGTGTEVVYVIRIDRPMTLIASVDYPGTTFDSVLYLRRACNEPTTQLACSDDVGGTNTRSSLTASLTPGSYYLIIDGKTPAATGAYTLTANLYAGLGETCTNPQECAPGHVCRVAAGGSGMTCERPVCNDGRDDDGDTIADFPNDPGCTTPDDMTEQDTCPGAGCPACADGMDNDNDTRTDYPNDTSCTSASGTSEADCPTETDALQVVTAGSSSGTTAGAGNQFAPSCATGSNAPDRVHMLYVRAPLASLTIDTNDSAFDTVLMLKDALCGTTDVSCNRDGGTPFGRSRIALTGVGVGSYAIVVDGDFTGSGAYNLHVAGTYANGMACDPTMPMFTCNAGYACSGVLGSATCQPAACNDTTDADGDGDAGYPNDPGCTSISDGDETDDCFPTVGPNCPQCANGIDDDMDNQTDYPADTGCASASSANEQCITTDPVRTLTTATLTNQSTAALANDLDLSCGTDGRDEVFRVRVDFPINELRVDTIGSNLDTVLALKTPSCSAFDAQCDDNSAGNGDSEVFLVTPALGEYFIVVDDKNIANPQTYNLRVRGSYANGGRCSPTSVFTCNTGYACTGAAGAETCNPAACNDTTDADGDGLPGYPSDPGCTSTSDGDESDTCFPTPMAGCPACANDVDDDMDGFTDYPMDPACLAASVNSELAPCTSSDPVLVFSSNVTGHSTAGRLNDVLLSCGANGRDQIYRLFVTQPLVSLTVDTLGSDIATALAVRGGTCNGTDLGCGVNNFGNMDSRVTLNTVAVGEYFLIVDDQSTANPTTYNLNVSGTLAAGNRCNPASTSFICTAGYTCGGTAGAETCVPTVCNDMADADGDGRNGYPSDPGCTDISDTSEADDCPTGPMCPVCSNGMDDDGDTRTDYPMDLGCTAASGSTELECQGEDDPILTITAGVTNGNTTGAMNDWTPTCQGSSNSDRAYILNLPLPVTTLRMDTIGTTWDTILQFMDSTCGMSIACDDDGSGVQSIITRTNVAAGTYAIIVDGWSSSNNGPFILNVRGTVAAGTACTHPSFASGLLACPTSCNAGVCQ